MQNSCELRLVIGKMKRLLAICVCFFMCVGLCSCDSSQTRSVSSYNWSLEFITDLDGNFTLSVPVNSTLKITYIGYKPVTVKSATIVNVLLEEDTQMEDEVVVTGYTTQRKADLTGAVSVVKVDEIQKQGENNPVKALQGRVPGMNITADGNPSGSATVRIRGIGTLNNNDPLYIIDGVPTKAGMHELNGNDIESIQVLKDAASASIYG